MSRRPRLTKDDLEAWRAHPVTEIVDQYLRDLEQDTRNQCDEAQDWTDVQRHQIQFIQAYLNLMWDEITDFYEEYEGRDEQDSESDAD